MNGFRPEPPVLSPKRSPRRARRARRRPLCCPRQFRGRSPAATGRTPSREPAQRSAQRVGLGFSFGFRVFVRFTLLGDVVLGLETLYDLVTFRLPWVSKGFCRMLTSGCRTKTSSACGLSGRSWPCAGLRSVRWNAPNALECAECAGMRWNALECADCAELRRMRRLRAVCAELLRLRWNCAGILPTAWHTAIYPWLAQPGCDLLTCSLQFPGSACRARFLWLTTPPVPAVLRFFVSHAERQTMPVKN